MPRPHIVLLLTLAAGLGISGCKVTLNDPGTDPRPAEFLFPAGLAVDPEEPYLYVSNGNSDLRFGGGTVQMVDTERFDCAVKQFRGQPIDGVRCTNAAADAAACVWDALDPNLVNCDEKPFILANATVKVGNFAGNIVVQRRPESASRRRLFVGVRGDPSITWIDVDFAKDRNQPRMLDCFDPTTDITSRRGYDAATNTTTIPAGCDPSHQLQTYSCIGQPMCTAGVNTIPIEPFSLKLDEGTLASGAEYSRLVVSHLSAGQIMLVDVRSSPLVRYVSNPFFTADQANRRGAFALAPQRPGDPASPWYLTSNLQATIATFRIAEVGVVVPSVAFSIGGAFPNGNDVRDIAFEAGGNRAFLTENNPPTLVVLDTRTLPDSPTPSLPINQVVDIVDVCQTPSHLGTRTIVTPGAPGAPPRTQTRLYVVCFLSNQIMVVDPDSPTVLDTTLVGRGPNDIAFSESQQRAYVTNFAEWTIGVIDLERGSPTENRMVARIGIPEPPVRQ